MGGSDGWLGWNILDLWVWNFFGFINCVYNYFIYDLNGKTVSKGQINNGYNSISTPAMNAAGMYFIRFSNDAEQWIEKFVRQYLFLVPPKAGH